MKPFRHYVEYSFLVATLSDDIAEVTHNDTNGKQRIVAGTFSDDQAIISNDQDVAGLN